MNIVNIYVIYDSGKKNPTVYNSEFHVISIIRYTNVYLPEQK